MSKKIIDDLLKLIDEYAVITTAHGYWRAKAEAEGDKVHEEKKHLKQAKAHRAKINEVLEEMADDHASMNKIMDFLTILEDFIKADIENIYKSFKEEPLLHLLTHYRSYIATIIARHTNKKS